MKQEKIIIKNFGPIIQADIIIKPFMVLIGESGSGKSIVLKLLSLLRWIAKKNHYEEFAKTLGIEKYYSLRMERLLKDSGLEEFINDSTYIEYIGQTEEIIIQKENNAKLTIRSTRKKEEISLEKISFITDDRFAVVLLLNNQIRGLKSSLPYHLEKTYEDFNDSFENLSEDKKLNIKTMDFKILKEKYGAVEQRYFLQNQEAKIQLHNASSGMKSISIIEPILTYFSTAYDKEEVFKNFLIEMYVRGRNYFENSNDFFKKIGNLEENKHFRLNFFIEEPELSLFPNAQKKLIDFFSEVFNNTPNVNIAFSTHSPYMLSSLNCLLKAYELGHQKPKLQKEIKKLVPKQYWLSFDKFAAYKIKNGEISDIIDKDTKLILADEIDEVSEEIGFVFDTLLDLEFE